MLVNVIVESVKLQLNIYWRRHPLYTEQRSLFWPTRALFEDKLYGDYSNHKLTTASFKYAQFEDLRRRIKIYRPDVVFIPDIFSDDL